MASPSSAPCPRLEPSPPCPPSPSPPTPIAEGGGTPIPGLGHSGNVRALRAGERLTFRPNRSGDVTAIFAFVPSQPVAGDALRVRVSVDGQAVGDFDLVAKPHSKAWWRNILRNQAQVTLPLTLPEKAILSLEALDDGILFDSLRL